MPRVVIKKLAGDRRIARDQERFGEGPQVKVPQIRELILGLDPVDSDGDGNFPRKLPSDGKEENKMPKEKAVRRFGLRKRDIVVSSYQVKGMAEGHTRSWKRRRCAASFHRKVEMASIRTETRATTSPLKRIMVEFFGNAVDTRLTASSAEEKLKKKAR